MHETVARTKRRSIVLRRIDRRGARDVGFVNGASDALDPIRSYDGAASLPTRPGREERVMVSVATPVQTYKREAKRHYHGPRLSRFLPHFVISIVVIEVLALLLGGK